jgi:hypothetical protein
VAALHRPCYSQVYVSTESACNGQSGGGPDSPFSLLLPVLSGSLDILKMGPAMVMHKMEFEYFPVYYSSRSSMVPSCCCKPLSASKTSSRKAALADCKTTYACTTRTKAKAFRGIATRDADQGVSPRKMFFVAKALCRSMRGQCSSAHRRTFHLDSTVLSFWCIGPGFL